MMLSYSMPLGGHDQLLLHPRAPNTIFDRYALFEVIRRQTRSPEPAAAPVVEGRRNQEIRILDIRPIIITRTAPLDGTLFFLPPQGAEPTLQMATNLDALIPIISTVDTNGHPLHDAYFEKNSISLVLRARLCAPRRLLHASRPGPAPI
ncbi:MAG: hypothetical protein ACRDRX_03990 [Pseudonocardiaceae bacterium]